jgi:hypothetical protein
MKLESTLLLAVLAAAFASGARSAGLDESTVQDLAASAAKNRPARRAAAPAKAFSDEFKREAAPADKLAAATDPARVKILDQYAYRRVDGDPAEKTIELAFALDVRSAWGSSEKAKFELLEELRKTTAIFEQCAVRVGAVYVADVDYSDALRHNLTMDAVSPYDPPAETQVLSALSSPVRPLTLLIGDGYTHVYNLNAVQGLEGTQPAARSLLDVVAYSWQIAGDYAAQHRAQPSFSLLAHELTHVLGNIEHVNIPQPNLMNIYDGASPEEAGRAKSGDLLPEQCGAIHRFAQARVAAAR